MNLTSSKIIRWLPAIIWMTIIFFFSGLPTTGVTGSSSFSLLSIYWQRYLILKFFHLVEYAILFILIYFATGVTLRSLLLSYLYACSDEFHQSFTPGRSPRISDTLIDLFGMAIGWYFINQIYPKINPIRKK